MQRLRRILFIGTAFFALSAGLSRAQVITAAIHGTVMDSTGAVVPGAVVTATDTSTGVSTEARTNAAGNYEFPQLPIGGPYTVEIVKTGFQNFQANGLVLDVNDDREVDAKLQVGGASQTIQVQAAAVHVDTVDTELKQVITASEIEQAPLLNRDASGLQKLAAGTVEASDETGAYATNGNQTQENSYRLNGADNNDAALQTIGLIINPDALAEEDFVSSTINPEFARNSGAIINQVIKSGTNSFHGSGFWYYRDTFMNNGDYFSKTRPNFHQNIFGGTLGGPIVKGRLFFFAAYQGIRNRSAATQNSPVLSDAQRDGDFTGDPLPNPPNPSVPTLSANPMPFAVDGCPAGTPWDTCFPGANPSVVIPTSDFNRISSRLVGKFVPPANSFSSGPTYIFNSANSYLADQGVLRADYHIGSRDSLWASGVFQSSPGVNTLGFEGSDLPGFGTHQAEHYKLFMSSWTHTFNAATLNQISAGLYRLNFAAVEPQQVVSPASYGFSVTPQSPQMNLPSIAVAGLDGPGSSFLGFSVAGPQPRKDVNVTVADNFTRILGNHSLKIGALWEQIAESTPSPYAAYNNGAYTFAGGGAYSSGDPVLDFMLGIPDQYLQTSGGLIDLTGREYYAYAQDSWRATHDLTLNYGLAWDVETPYQNHQFGGIGVTCWAPDSRTSNVLMGGPPGLTYPGDPGCNRAGGPTAKWNHVGPRVGFAWSPSSGPESLIGTAGEHKFAVRGGFGLYYNRDSQQGELQNMADPPFFFESLGVSGTLPGTSPGFADPFSDVAGNGSIQNPFPFARPTPGQDVDFMPYAPFVLSAYDRNYAVPYTYNFNLNIQRELPSDIILEIGYVGSLGHRLIRAYEGDRVTAAGHAACLENPLCVAFRSELSLYFPQYKLQPATIGNSGFPWYLSVGTQHTDGSSNYNSLQVTVTKRATHGLYFTAAYTYSHAMDNASGLESSGFNGRGINTFPGFEQLSYGDSDYDARQRLVGSYIYAIPLIPGWHSLLAREALGGWQLSGMTALQSGFPVTITDAGVYNSLDCDAFSFFNCPDAPDTSTFRVKSLNPRSAGHPWFDPSTFSQEPIGTFGNVGRNYFHGPGFNYTNLSLSKNFPIAGEGRYLQVRLEAYNVFNHANFDQPVSNFTSAPFFGSILSVKHSYDTNSDPSPGRDIQLAARLVF